jgi:hypothetical protein
MKRHLGNQWIRIAIGLFALGSIPLALLAVALHQPDGDRSR